MSTSFLPPCVYFLSFFPFLMFVFVRFFSSFLSSVQAVWCAGMRCAFVLVAFVIAWPSNITAVFADAPLCLVGCDHRLVVQPVSLGGGTGTSCAGCMGGNNSMLEKHILMMRLFSQSQMRCPTARHLSTNNQQPWTKTNRPTDRLLGRLDI